MYRVLQASTQLHDAATTITLVSLKNLKDNKKTVYQIDKLKY